MIYIFSAATNNYKQYIDLFVKTLPLFFEGFDKKLILFSDQDYINNLNDIYIYNYHIPHSTYVLYGLNKLNYVIDYFNYIQPEYNESSDIIMFFDIDTYFIQKDKSYWDNLYNEFINKDLFFTINWWILYLDKDKKLKYKYDWPPSKEFNINSCAYCNKNNDGLYNIPPLIVSFYGGKLLRLKELNEMLINHILVDTYYSETHPRILCQYIDEGYINRIINDNLIDCSNIIYKIYCISSNSNYLNDYLHSPNSINEIIQSNDTIFCFQKYSNIKLFIKTRNYDNNEIKKIIKFNN